MKFTLSNMSGMDIDIPDVNVEVASGGEILFHSVDGQGWYTERSLLKKWVGKIEEERREIGKSHSPNN